MSMPQTCAHALHVRPLLATADGSAGRHVWMIHNANGTELLRDIAQDRATAQVAAERFIEQLVSHGDAGAKPCRKKR